MAYPRRDIVAKHVKVDVTAVSQVLVAAFPSRLSLTIQNQDATNAVWLKLSNTVGGTPVAVADATSQKIPPGGVFSTTAYTGPVALICTTPTSVNVLDL
jgi:hypothetical protein